MNWVYADKFGGLPPGQAEIVEALVVIAEQLEQLNKTLSQLKINGVVNTKEAR